MRFVHNCHAEKEYRIKRELILDEIKDAEKQIIKNAQKKSFNDEYAALQKDNYFQGIVNYLDCVQNWMKIA